MPKGGWHVQTPQRFGEMASQMWGGTGPPRRCMLRGAAQKLWVDVVEVREVAAQFEQGCLLPAHGTVTIEVRSVDDGLALQELARTGEAIALERPDGRALEMRLGVSFTTRAARLDGELLERATVTYSWHSP